MIELDKLFTEDENKEFERIAELKLQELHNLISGIKQEIINDTDSGTKYHERKQNAYSVNGTDR